MAEEDPRRIENFHSNVLFFLRVNDNETIENKTIFKTDVSI